MEPKGPFGVVPATTLRDIILPSGREVPITYRALARDVCEVTSDAIRDGEYDFTVCNFGGMVSLRVLPIFGSESATVRVFETLPDMEEFLIGAYGVQWDTCCFCGIDLWSVGDSIAKPNVWPRPPCTVPEIGHITAKDLSRVEANIGPWEVFRP